MRSIGVRALGRSGAAAKAFPRGEGRVETKQLFIVVGRVPLTLYFPEDYVLEEAYQRYARFRAPRENGDGL